MAEANLAIRPAYATEADLLTQIALAAKRYWHYTDEQMAQWTSSLTVTPERIAQAMVYVAVLAQQIVGFYALILTEHSWLYELDDLWILPEQIGRGMGKRLFQHASATVLAKGGSALRLVAEPHAIGFYQKMGMTKIGERPSQPASRMLDVMEISLVRED